MATSAEAIPPPSYAQDAGSQALKDISTLDGKISAYHGFEVIRTSTERIEDQRIILKDEAMGQQEYAVAFETHPPSVEISKMILHRGDTEIARASISTTDDDVLGTLTLGASKVKVIEQRSKSSIRASQAASLKANGDNSKHSFEVGDLVWRTSKGYLHPNKGKSRAGDLELVDSNGNIVAVFLNQWSGSPHTKDLGQLYLTQAAASQSDGSGSLPLAILSALVVIMHLSWRDRDGAKEFFKDLLSGSLLCSMM